MLKTKGFWILQNVVVIAFWLAVLGLIVSGQTQHRLLLIAAIVLVAHVLELPIAFRVLRGRSVPAIKTTVMTLLFGYTWWMPVRRGIYTG